MSDLIVEKLGNISNIEMGQSPDSRYYQSEEIGVPLIQGNADIKGRKSIKRIWTTHITKECDAGDILMTVRAPVGFIGIASHYSCIGRGVCAIKPTDVDAEYLYHLLIFYEGNWKALEQGSTFTAVGSKEISNFSLKIVKSKTEQRKISQILSTADAVIEKTQAAIAKYKAIKQGMLHDLFTRGIDLKTGKLRPRYEDAPELYKESKLGWVPREWGEDKLDYYFDFLRSGLSRLLSEQDIGIPVLISGNIQENKLDFSSLKYWYVNDPQGADTNSYVLSDGDILLCFINSIDQIGKVAIFENYFRPCIYTTNLFRIKPSVKAKPKFLYYLMCSGIVQNEIKAILKPAVNQASFTTKDFCKIPVPNISEKEQIIICKNLEKIDKKIQSEQNYLQKLQQLKQGLMSDLLSGRVKVSESQMEGIKG